MLAGQTATNWETSLLRRNPLKLPNDIGLELGEVVVRGIKVVCAYCGRRSTSNRLHVIGSTYDVVT